MTLVKFLAAITLVILTAGCASPPPSSQPTATAPSDPQADGVTAAFYGDSYTLGTGASSFEKRWSTILCEERGWREVNPSVNGLGFVNNRPADSDILDRIIAEQPEIVFVTMGLNDNFSYVEGDDQIRAQIGRDLDRLRAELPEARIIVVEPFWYTDQREPSVEVIIGWVRDAAREIDADFIPGASRWLEGHPEWMAADGLHPNDEGYAEMAKRMEVELSKLEPLPVD